jgi:hypothetical protein
MSLQLSLLIFEEKNKVDVVERVEKIQKISDLLGVDFREEGWYAHITVLDEGHERPPAATPHRRHAR